jgi:hypothetical protein
VNVAEYVSEHAARIAQGTVRAIDAGVLSTLGEIEEHIDRELGDITDELKAVATGAASPMMQSAIASMKPAIMEALHDYTPTFAAISGGMLALAVLLGVYVAQKTYTGWRR